MIKFKLKQVKPRIFLMEFTDQYDMCMTFLRYQESYESPNPKFRNKQFTLVDFMEWYAKQHGGVFTYPLDWGGFNIPSSIIANFLGDALDHNKYDEIMEKVYDRCLEKVQRKYNTDKFYIIGAKKGQAGILNHEISHGFFYTIPQYKKEMTALVKALKPSFIKSLCSTLKKLGYTHQVYIDECQAYMATGLTTQFKVKLKGEDKPFIELFNKYNKLIK